MAVTPADIATELGQAPPAPDSVTYSQWQTWIADALMLIQVRYSDLATLDQERLGYVVRQAVASHVRRPDDATQVSVSVDDGSVSRTYRSSSGRVEILDEWWALLSPDPTQSTTAFSIRPGGDTGVHLDWCALSLGALYCSCGTDIAGSPIFEDSDEY